MLNMIINEIKSLQGKSKIISYSLLILSTIVLFISCTIYAVPVLQNIYTLDIALYLSIVGILLFLEGATVGILLNLIDKRKRNSV